MFFKKDFLSIVQILFYLMPISIVAGSMIININIILFIIIGYSYFISKGLKFNFDTKNFFLLAFFLFIIFSSFINKSIIGDENFLKSIFLLKFFLIFILIEGLLINDKINIKNFFRLCAVTVIFISIDLIFQFYFGRNLLGFEPWEGRITGIFGSEAIAGGFIQKFFIFSLIGIFFFFEFNKSSKIPFEIILVFIIMLSAFLASNRMSFVLTLISLFTIIIFIKILRKKLLTSLAVCLAIFIYLFNTNDQINYKFHNFKFKVEKLSTKSIDLIKQNEEKKIINSPKNNHIRIYVTSLKSFAENKFLGNGLKSFRFKCENFINNSDGACSTHPHNYHIEILHDTGIVGFILISTFIILILFKKIKSILRENYSYDEKIILALLILNIFIEIFPLKSTGSLFSTWTGTILWISIGLLSYQGKKKNYEKR